MAHQRASEALERKSPFPSPAPDKLPRLPDGEIMVVDVEDSSDEGGDGEVAAEERLGDRRAVRVSSSQGLHSSGHPLVDAVRDCSARGLPPKPLEPHSGGSSVMRKCAQGNVGSNHGLNRPPSVANGCDREIIEIDGDDDDGRVACRGDGSGCNNAHFYDCPPEQKGMRSFGRSDHVPFDFNACTEQVEGWMRRMKTMSVERNRACVNARTEVQHLKRSIREKDLIIQSLKKARAEDIKRRWEEKFRFEHDLGVLRRLVNDYRKALKDGKNEFDEYRKQFLKNGGPLYSDSSRTDGTVLCNAELEKKHSIGQHELCFLASEMVNDFQRVWCLKFAGYVDWFANLARKLVDLDQELKILSEKVRGSINHD